jgi:hypothetical protein
MSIDPRLQALFTAAEQALDREAFLRDVMAKIDRSRHRLLLVWAGVSIVAVIGLALLASPVITAITMATNLLPVSLVDIETRWLQQLLAPVNSVAAGIALGALGIRKFYRWLFG